MEEKDKQYVEELRAQYTPATKEEEKFETLRKMNASVYRPARITAWTVGIVAALVLGVGMNIVMDTLSAPFAVGIVIGVVGLALAGANYFLYRAIVRARKKKYGQKIVALSDELLAQENA